MRFILHAVVVAVMFMVHGGARAQEKPTAAPPAPSAQTAPLATSQGAFFPFPPEEKVKIRDLQFQMDQLEIENQKLLVKVEQNKAKAKELLYGIQGKAYEFAQKNKIDTEKYELDLGEIRFQEKRAK